MVMTRRLTDDQAAELVGLYLDGVPVKDLMDRYGILRRTVHDYLKRSGCERRATGRPRPFAGREAELAADYRAGMTQRDLAEKYEASRNTVALYASKASSAVPQAGPLARDALLSLVGAPGTRSVPAVPNEFPYKAYDRLTALIEGLTTMTARDPEQEVTGFAVPVLDAVVEAIKDEIGRDNPVVNAVAGVISPETIEAAQPIRAADALLVAKMLAAEIGEPPMTFGIA